MLTAKMKRFCDEYLIDLNATQAAIRAGYSKKTAKQIGNINLTKLDVREYIDARMREKEAELIASQDEVLKYLTSVMRNQKKEEVVVVEGCGDGISEAKIVKKDVSIKDRSKAAELLGKRYGIFNDKLTVDGAIPVVVSGENDLED